MEQPKKLSKIVRNSLFEKVYRCFVCEKTPPEFLRQYGQDLHFEHENIFKMFRCKRCTLVLKNVNILQHVYDTVKS